MYPANTILSAVEPKGDALDELRVVGLSPIKRASVAEWSGSGEHFIVTSNVAFGTNEVAAADWLAAHYSVKEYPAEEPSTRIVVDRMRSGAHAESPEQVFARQAREAKAPEPSSRKKTPHVAA